MYSSIVYQNLGTSQMSTTIEWIWNLQRMHTVEYYTTRKSSCRQHHRRLLETKCEWKVTKENSHAFISMQFTHRQNWTPLFGDGDAANRTTLKSQDGNDSWVRGKDNPRGGGGTSGDGKVPAPGLEGGSWDGLMLIKPVISAACTFLYEIHHNHNKFLKNFISLPSSKEEKKKKKKQDQRGTGFGSR